LLSDKGVLAFASPCSATCVVVSTLSSLSLKKEKPIMINVIRIDAIISRYVSVALSSRLPALGITQQA